MIHRPIDPVELSTRISELTPTWLTRAARETAVNRGARCHSSATKLWSEIKPIFVEHQREKCAYCERRLGSAGIEWDVEHFRPKRKVDAWSPRDKSTKRTGRADAKGYYLLAFNQLNYLVSCKPCNSNYKKNYFPVARKRALSTADAADLASEKAYLLNPLDGADEAPEDLIGFHGIIPRVLSKDSHRRRRARITIEVLGLTRADLELPRSEAVQNLWLALEFARNGSNEARMAVENLTGIGSEFTNCARSFKSLYERDRNEAERLAKLAIRFVHPRVT